MLQLCMFILAVLAVHADTHSRVLVQYADAPLTLNDTTIGTAQAPALPDSIIDTISLPALGLDIYTVNEDPIAVCEELLDTVPGISSCEPDSAVSLEAGSADPDDTYYAQQSQFQLGNFAAAWAAGYYGTSTIRACVVDSKCFF